MIKLKIYFFRQIFKIQCIYFNRIRIDINFLYKGKLLPTYKYLFKMQTLNLKIIV